MAGKESIVFINQNAGYLMIDIIHAHTEYHQRAIITGKLVPRNESLDDSVVVEKIITYNRSSGIKRLFTWFWGFIQILWLVKPNTANRICLSSPIHHLLFLSPCFAVINFPC